MKTIFTISALSILPSMVCVASEESNIDKIKRLNNEYFGAIESCIAILDSVKAGDMEINNAAAAIGEMSAYVADLKSELNGMSDVELSSNEIEALALYYDSEELVTRMEKISAALEASQAYLKENKYNNHADFKTCCEAFFKVIAD